ncbi:hypothetical protein JCM8097_006598 [Rhodosporidiobolus ruineniae]
MLNRLPTELLLRIFSFVAASTPAPDLEDDDKERRLQIVKHFAKWEDLQRTVAPSLLLYEVKPSPLPAPFSFRFPYLVQPSLDLFHLSVDEAHTFFTTATFPHLRALALGQVCLRDDPELAGAAFLPALPADFVAQLDVLQLQHVNYFTEVVFADRSATLRAPPSPSYRLTVVLVTVSDWCDNPRTLRFRAVSQHARHIRLPSLPSTNLPGCGAAESASLRLLHLVDAVDRVFSSLTSIHLPSELRQYKTSISADVPASPSPPLPASSSSALPSSSSSSPVPLPISSLNNELSYFLEHLLALCKTRNIDVEWHDDVADGMIAVSRSFWAFAKRLKAKQAAA